VQPILRSEIGVVAKYTALSTKRRISAKGEWPANRRNYAFREARFRRERIGDMDHGGGSTCRPSIEFGALGWFRTNTDQLG
jgi:hypothetical protein